MSNKISRRDFLTISAGALLGVAFARRGWNEYLERQALSNLSKPLADSPNVLIIVLDTVRALNLSLYGYHRSTTPNLEKLAGDGILFKRAVAPAPWTLPSHASLFTGRYHHELSVGWEKPLDHTYPTLAEILYQHGYLTAGFAGNTMYCAKEFGLARGFIHYEDYIVSADQIIHSSSIGKMITNNLTFRKAIEYYDLPGRKSAARVNNEFIRWLSTNDQRPFFAFLNYFDAHLPYLPPEPYDDLFGTKEIRKHPSIDPAPWWPEKEIQAAIDSYDGAIAYVDHHIGLLFDELRARSLLENTLVVITSDHGEEFGEHNLFSHGKSLYWPSLFVPLLVLFPKRYQAGKSVESTISLRDIPATLLDYLNLSTSESLPGNSFLSYLDNSPQRAGVSESIILAEVSKGINAPRSWPTSKGSLKSAIMDNYHYIIDGEGFEEVYDIQDDPLEKINLVDRMEGQSEIKMLRDYVGAIPVF